MNQQLKEFLDNAETGRRCVVCRHEEVADIIEAHLDLLKSGKSKISLSQVHSGLILPAYGVPKGMDTVRSHVRRCLKRDPATGESL